jgi:type I restriction enzyme S subunit
MPVAVPPIAEQAFIARFLAWATNRLDSTIGAKRRIIALLQEQKQAIIHRAVTRGLDPSVPLKDSGIPWLGEIPVDWEVMGLRMRYTVELGKMLDAKKITGRHSIPYLRNRDVQWDRVLTADLPVMDIPPSEIGRYTLQAGDLLVCEGGQVGRSAFWYEQLPVCGFQKALHRVRCLDSGNDYPRFFFYQMQLVCSPRDKRYNTEYLLMGEIPWPLAVRCCRWFLVTTMFSNSRASPTQGHCLIQSCSGRRSFWLAEPVKPTPPSPIEWG